MENNPTPKTLTTASPPTTPPPQPPTTPPPPPPPPSTPPEGITSYPRLLTPPRGSIATPTSHRRNRHAPPPLNLAPMIATPRGVVTLNPLPRPDPESPTTNRTRTVTAQMEGLQVIGEDEEEEGMEVKEVKLAPRKIRFEDEKSSEKEERSMEQNMEKTEKQSPPRPNPTTQKP